MVGTRKIIGNIGESQLKGKLSPSLFSQRQKNIIDRLFIFAEVLIKKKRLATTFKTRPDRIIGRLPRIYDGTSLSSIASRFVHSLCGLNPTIADHSRGALYINVYRKVVLRKEFLRTQGLSGLNNGVNKLLLFRPLQLAMKH